MKCPINGSGPYQDADPRGLAILKNRFSDAKKSLDKQKQPPYTLIHQKQCLIQYPIFISFICNRDGEGAYVTGDYKFLNP